MEIQGIIKHIGQTQVLGANGFEKREFIITTEGQYPDVILFQCIKDKCALLDVVQVGQSVRVSFNINGREWTNPQGQTKIIQSLNAWKIETVQITNVANQGAGAVPQQPIYQQAPQGYTQPQAAPSQVAPSQAAPAPQAATAPQQTSMFDNYGQAPAKQEEDDDMPF